VLIHPAYVNGPVEHALQLAATLPRCLIFVDPDEGHHFFRRRLKEILSVLLRPEGRPTDETPAGHAAPAPSEARR
jgi:hypothetical protein